MSVPFSLRDYQIKACAAVEEAWASGIRRPLINMATGSGKTCIFASLIKRDREAGGKRALVLAHRDELLQQAADKIRMVYPEVSIGFVRQKENDVHCDVVVASVQSISRDGRLKTLPRDFSLVVCDEAHHAVAPFHRKVLEYVGALSNREDAPRLLGVTATPQRADNVGLDDVFQKVVFKFTILEGIVSGYLCDLRVEAIRVRVDWSKVKTIGGDYADGALADALMAADAPHEIVAAYKRSAMGRKAICFTPTVKLAQAVTEAFNAAGITTEWLDGTTKTEKRRDILARLKTGETQIVANAAVLTEGFDEPSIECVIVARPSKSQALYIQMVGRGARPSPLTGKTDCKILDVSGASDTHRLVTLSDITGLPASLLQNKTVLEALRDVQREPRNLDRPGGEIEHLPAANPFSEFSWSALDGQFKNFYALAVAEGGFIYVMPADENVFDVLRYDRQSPECADGFMETVAENLPLEYALGRGEDLVRDSPAMRLTVANAAWRTEIASGKQLEYVRRERLSNSAVLTKGQAADLINTHIARLTLDRLMRVQNTA